MASSWTLNMHPQSFHILHAYMSTKLLPTKTSDLQKLNELFMNEHAHQVLLNQHICVCNLNKSEFVRTWMPFHCIHWKSCYTFWGCPSFTHFVSFSFHAKMFSCTLPGAAAIHARFCQLSSWSASCVSLHVKPGNLSFAYNPKSGSSHVTVHILGINAIIWTAKPHWSSPSAREFCHSILHLLTFSNLLVLSHQYKRSEKNICQSLDHGRIATKKEHEY